MASTQTVDRRLATTPPEADGVDVAQAGIDSAAIPRAHEGTSHRYFPRVVRSVVLGATDLSALLLACGTAYVLWALPERGQSIRLYLSLSPLLFLFVLGYAQAGLYPGFGIGPVENLRRLSYVSAFGFLALAGVTFALKTPAVYSRATFAFALSFSLVTVPLGRTLVGRLTRGFSWWTEPVIVIGTGRRAARAIRGLQEQGTLGYRPVAVVATAAVTGDTFEGVPICGGLPAVSRLAARGIQVALVEADRAVDTSFVNRLQREFRHVVLLRYDELPVEGVQVRNLGGVVGIEYTNNLLLPVNRVVKRAIDVVFASLALVVATPVMACATMLVKMVDGSPLLFVQSRTGLGGRRIAMPKIRTMQRDAEEQLEKQLEADPALRKEWETRNKLREDPRLIPVIGRFLRRYSIDELPQLWAVLDGRMSLVGPRPFPDYHMKLFSPDFLDLRQRVRPGITGLWQVNVRSEGGIDQQETYDTYYIRNWSVWLDVYILSRTMAAVASGRGAY